MSRVKVYSKYGDPRRKAAQILEDQAASNDPTPHGMDPSHIEKLHNWMESIEPGIYRHGKASHNIVDDILPEGASLDPRRRKTAQVSSSGLGFGGGSGPNTLVSPMQPYQPEMADQSRQSYPIMRILANRYWRLFNKTDPFTSTFVNMIAELVWSDFQLTGEHVDGEIKQTFESMCEETQLRSMLPWLVKEFLVIGEVCPHLFYESNKGMWTHISMLNPDQTECVYSPFVKMDPIVEFVPDDRLRQIVTSTHPMLRKVREAMPEELVAALSSRRNIPLSPVNFTFLPRKLHPYDIRGTSMLSTLWRTYMIEDALASSLISTARRASRPLKCAKLGTPDGTWIPGPDYEQKVLRALAQAEVDSEAWIILNYGIQFEMVGEPSRALNLANQFDFLEKVKCVAFGVSRSFLTGEQSYSCFTEGSEVVMADFSRKPIEQVRKGDKVRDENDEIQTVQKAWCEGTPDEVVEIELNGGTKLTCTKNHKWPVWAWPRECACGCGAEVNLQKCFKVGHARWSGVETVAMEDCKNPRKIPEGYEPVKKLRADELRLRDFLHAPRNVKATFEVDPDLATIVGYYAAEGYLSWSYSKYQVYFSMGLHEKYTHVAHLMKLLTNLGIPCAGREDKDNGYLVMTSGTPGARLAEDVTRLVGRFSKEKFISEEIHDWSTEAKYHFLRGAFVGDGHQKLDYTLNSSGRKTGPYLGVGYTTASKDLHDGLWKLLVDVGYMPTAHSRWRERDFSDLGPKNGVHEGWCHELRLTGAQAIEFAEFAWREYSLHTEVRKVNEHRPMVLLEEDKIRTPIMGLRVIPNDKPVYNLTISGSHSYQVSGIATYNSAAAGLSIFLQRLLAVRQYFESAWLIPKFFRQIAVMNKFIKPKASEVSGPGPWVRTKRSASNLLDEGRYIVPTIEWEKSLDPSANTERLSALATLQGQLGVKVSKRTILATVGLDYEQELKQIKKEVEIGKKIVGKDLEVAAATGVTIPGMAPPMAGGEGGGGSMVAPALPTGALGDLGPPSEGDLGGGQGDIGGTGLGGESAPPAGSSGDSVPLSASGSSSGPSNGKGKIADDNNGQHSDKDHDELPMIEGWEPRSLESLKVLFKDMDHADPESLEDPWTTMMMDSKEVQDALRSDDKHALWTATEDWLIGEGFPTRTITQLQDLLIKSRHLDMTGHPSVTASQKESEILARYEAQLRETNGGLPDAALWSGIK